MEDIFMGIFPLFMLGVGSIDKINYHSIISLLMFLF